VGAELAAGVPGSTQRPGGGDGGAEVEPPPRTRTPSTTERGDDPERDDYERAGRSADRAADAAHPDY
jgi:hypothetical protein